MDEFDAEYIRALEVTYGEHGWHVHLHVMVVTDRQLTVPEEMMFQSVLTAKWQRCVELELGEEHVPNDEHAVRFTRETPLQYASKLDLELTDPGDAKTAHGVKPWDLLRCARSGESTFTGIDGDYEVTPSHALHLFREYERDMKGARLHTASNRILWLLEDATSEGVFATVFAGAPTTGDPVVGELMIPATLFDALRDVPGALSGILRDSEDDNAVERLRERIRELMRTRALAMAWAARVLKYRVGAEARTLDFGAPVNPLAHLNALRWIHDVSVTLADDLGAPIAHVVERRTVFLFPDEVPADVQQSQFPLNFPY
jgi:hypothetical protein